MNKNINDNNTNIESFEISLLVESVSTLIEKIENPIKQIINSDEVNAIKVIGTELSEAVKIFKIIENTMSIPDKLFMKKINRYFDGLVSIPISKRESYVKKVGKKSLNEDSVFILGILNKTEELSKIDIFIKLFEAKIYEKIDDPTYRRMMLLVDRTMYSDIMYLKEHICGSSIKLESEEEENLFATGWLIPAGIGIDSATQNSCSIYFYTKTAKNFCKIVYEIDYSINKNTQSETQSLVMRKSE